SSRASFDFDPYVVVVVVRQVPNGYFPAAFHHEGGFFQAGILWKCGPVGSTVFEVARKLGYFGQRPAKRFLGIGGSPCRKDDLAPFREGGWVVGKRTDGWYPGIQREVAQEELNSFRAKLFYEFNCRGVAKGIGVNLGGNKHVVADDRSNVPLDNLAQGLKDCFLQSVSGSRPVILIDCVKPVDWDPLLLAERKVPCPDPPERQFIEKLLAQLCRGLSIINRFLQVRRRDREAIQVLVPQSRKLKLMNEGEEAETLHEFHESARFGLK